MLPITQVIEALRDSCRSGDTGAFFVATEEGHWAEIVLDKGHIICLRYRTKKGMEAIPAMARATRAKFSFSAANDVGIYSVCKDQQKLPATKEIVQLLGVQAQRYSQAAKRQAAGQAPARPRQAPAPKPRPASQPRPAPGGAKPAPGAPKPSAESRVRREPEVPKPKPRQTRPGHQAKVLVVEDSTVSRKVITNTLAKKGFQIAEAEDGFQALAQLGNEKPDLVLLDLILPGMDGYKVLTHMQKKPEFASIPVIILTSKDTLFDKLRGRMSGSDEYLTKPFSPTELLAKVEKYLG